MKKLSELGISPAPWKVDDREFGCDNQIWCEYISDKIVKGEKRTKVVAKCNAYFDTYKPDAHLIAAAPLMYEALLEMVEMYRDGGSYDYEQEVITKAKAALAKATGESEAKNGN